ncbi:MAG: asparagine synthase (glutamine-hydrolyzing) [Planctomycetota bacterium]
MCGIAGSLGLPLAVARPAVERMRAALRHRGPDDEGLVVLEAGDLPPVVLAHTRLSIVDLSPTGHQPLPADEQDPQAPWIVFNGEAYEAPELRQELALRGRACRGTSDTEAVLRGYQEWGLDCYERVRGMFAWCVADPGARRVWLARDRLGIKPLYLSRPEGGGLLFASELRALLAAGAELVPRRLHAPALEGFLAQGAVFGDQSLVAGARLLPAGGSFLLDWEGRPLREEIRWRPPFVRPPDQHEKKEKKEKKAARRELAVDRLHHVLREAVALHLRADVEVGLFLSGGVDSAGLATTIVEQRPDLHTISLGFDVPELDESAAAAAIARALGTRHHARRLAGAAALGAFEAVLDAVDQPTVDGFNTWFVAREARAQGLKVVLSGTGGDELFCGYESFTDVPRARRVGLMLGPARRALSLLAPFAGRLGRGVVKLSELARRPLDLIELYLLRRELLLPEERLALFPAGEGAGVPLAALAPLREELRGLDPVSRVSRLELGLYLQHMLLRDADAFSMAHSLELRVPLLDHRLVEEVAPLPARWKLGARGRPKPLLVDAVGPVLPKQALGPKRGFTFPWESWLRGPLAQRARDALGARATWQSLGFDSEAALRLGEALERGDPRVPALGVLALVVLEDYARRHGLTA